MGSKNIDRLSSLPDDVLSHILDLIPTKSAIRTSILSKRWRHNWKYVSNLHFDDLRSFTALDSFTTYVDRILELYKTTHVNSVCLDFSTLLVPNINTLKLIEETVRLNVSEIEIHSVFRELAHPFICKTLTKLTLVWNHRRWIDWNITYPVDLPLLKTLDIEVFTYPNRNAFKIIHGCPLIESLSLAVGFHKVVDEDYIFNIPTLKRLKLRVVYCIGIKTVVLNVPRLEDLILDGPLLSPFVMEDFPPLVSVSLSFFGVPGYRWVELLTGISKAKSLSLHVLPYSPSGVPMPKLPNLKYLDLTSSLYSCSTDWVLFHEILKSSSELEHLSIEEKPQNPFCFTCKDSCWIESRSVPTCMLKNLRTIKFTKFRGQELYMQYLSYILGNANVLKTLTIIFDILPREEGMRLSGEVMKLPRASRYCEIHFHGNQCCSTIS